MKRFSVYLVLLVVLVFIVSCGGSKKETVYDYPDDDASDLDISDTEMPDEVSDDADTEEPDDKDDSDTDTPVIPDNDADSDTGDTVPDADTDTDTGDTETPLPDGTYKISGILQAGSSVSSVEAALYECGKTDKIATADTDAKGNFSFNAEISAAKTYCVKAGDFASCFKGAGDHTANISEITTAAYLLDKNCSDIRKSETKIRIYAKLGTGAWLGELDYSKLSGISEGLKLLSSFVGSTNAKILSEKIAEDAKKDAPEFEKFFNGFRVFSDKSEIIIGETADNNANFSVEGGSTKVAPGFKINWTLKNNSAEAATYKFMTSIAGEYTARATLVFEGGDPIMAGDPIMGGDPIMAGDPIMLSQGSATVLFLQRKNGGTVYVSDTSKNISFRIDDGIYGVIPKGTVVKKNGSKINSISYDVLAAGGSQVSRLKFRPEGAVFEGDTMYFVHELGTVFGGDPIMLSAKRTNANGSVDVMNSAAGDPIMLAAAGDPIMTTAAGDPIMLAAAGDPIMTNAAGDPIMTNAAGDPIMSASAGDPIMTSAAGDPIMLAAAGDPIMMGTSSSTMISQTSHYSTFTVETANLPVSVEALLARWCDGSYYQGFSPIEFIREGVDKYKPEGDDKTNLMSYLDCATFGDLGNDLYELINKPVGFQRNLNLIENLFFTTEFHDRMFSKQSGTGFSSFVAVKNGLELRSAIAALYTATTSFNRSSTLADLFDPSMIPLTYSGVTPDDYTMKAKAAIIGDSGADDRYVAMKKEMMIFANYITTSSKGPDFSNVETLLTPDQLICAWFNPETQPQNCNKVYTLNEAGHVTLGGTEVTAAEANAIFTKFFMPMNSRLSESEKLDLFRTFYLALKYAGTIFYVGSDIEELREKMIETAYRVFDGINANTNAVTITDTFDASAHTVSVLDGAEMATVPYLTKLSALTDRISLKVAAESADVEKILINIEGYEFEKVQENTRTYYKPKGTLKEKSIILTPGTVAQGEKALRELLASENVDELGSITGKMTVVANSKISGKTYTTQKTYDFFVNDDGDGVNSKPVPADIRISVNDSTGHAIPDDANPTIILNPGNKVFYAENGLVSIENLAPAAYTVDAFADGYYAKSVSVNVPEGATFGVEIRLDEELTSSADANLELSVNINTVKHPSKVYIQIYNDDMDLVANEIAKFIDAENRYETLDLQMNSGRYTLLAVGEDMYNYLEAITLYEGNNEKSITVVAKNACGNGIVDSAEECEPSVEGSVLEVLCGEIYPSAPNPDKTAVCDPASCTFDKTNCGKNAICGDGIIDKPSEGCDGGSKACAEIAGFGNASGMAPCASDCSGYITANNCTKTTAECGTLPANALWNDGLGKFAQTYDGENWLPATKRAAFGTTKEECVFSCAKGYKWNGSICEQYPLSLALICTGATDCFDNTNETDCPAYGVAFFGQDAQYAAAKYCTPHTFSTSGSGNKKIVIDAYTHYEWQAASSSAMTWSQAEAACANYEQENGGSTAVWRLPSPAELLTIVDSGTASPALDDIFTTSEHSFWASEDAKLSKNAWRVDENGALTSVAKTTSNSVICVRVHDYDPGEERFTSTAETVKDNYSGLMWQKQAVASRTWAEALNYCGEVSTGEKFDWRLPNRNELASLVDYTKASGALSDFPAIAAQGFWTSTSSVNEEEKAWTVDFESGSITSADKTGTKYMICVRNDEPCLGGECADPCSFDACKVDGNSTGLCSANDYSFTCGCKSGFNWNHGKCLLATTRYIACVGLPENAVWNTVFGISQSYDGNNWYPSEVGTFNKIASSTECRFVCATNYKWDADEEKCLPVSRMVNCSEKKPYSDWNTVSKVSQTWDGEKWEPSSSSLYNEEPSEDECRFVCKEHYNWNDENKLCDPETQPATCIGLPANAHWWNEDTTITQTWTNGGWAPVATGAHSTDAEDNKCFFTCDANYEWNDTSCVAKSQTVNCVATTDNSEWTGGFSSIKQTWNGSEWFPSEVGTYNTEANSAYCRFKCKANYNWNGTSCEPKTQIASCGTLPANAVWNTVSRITQTYNGSEYVPAVDLIYSTTASELECRYTCRENYEPENENDPKTACKAKTQDAICTGLAENAVWWNGVSTVSQTWNGSEWLPTTVGTYSADNNQVGCFFKCNENYNWNQTYRRCDPKTQSASCGEPPANAQWNVYNEITQTWSENGWTPSTAGVYNDTPSPNECRFKCNENYTWNGSVCAADTKQEPCTGLPAYASWWNTTINKIWNGTGWEPNTVESRYSENAVENPGYCYFKCNENYEWSSSSNACVGKTQPAYCDDETLPQNAVWWNDGTVTQTWNGYGWLPTTIGSYKSDGAAGDGCYFKCKDYHYRWDQAYRSCDCADGYFWDGSECTSPCETAANNCGEHSICKATSADTFDCECESGYVSENLQCKERRIWSFEDAWEDTSSGPISVDNSAQPYHWVRSDVLGAKTGKYAMCSDHYPAEMTINVNMPEDGIVSFYIKGTQDTWNHDVVFALYVDGESDSNMVLTNRGVIITTGGNWERTGWAEWTQHSFPLTAGSHVLKFRYNSSNYQRFCIDDLSILPECYTSGTPCIDSSNGLIWSEKQEEKTWQTAFDYCGIYTESGLGGWKLPNINELRTLIQNCANTVTGGLCAVQDPDCLDNSCYPYDNCKCDEYNYYGKYSKFGDIDIIWSSSSNATYTNFALTGRFNQGGISSIAKSNSEPFRCAKNICDEGYLWDGTKCVKQCTASLCAPSYTNSTGSCANDYACGCNDGYFWNGSTCVSPCDYDPCRYVSDSTHVCTATAWNKYECGCESGFFWNGSDCFTPCDDDPCGLHPHSIGNCMATGLETYTCDCGSGYFWIDSECMPECSSTSGAPCIDSTSGMIWSGKMSSKAWQNAKNYCDSYSKDGLSNWHLPDISELRTLIKNCANTVIGGNCDIQNYNFDDCECDSNPLGRYSKFGETDYLWSSTEDEGNFAWYVNFKSAMVNSIAISNSEPFRCAKKVCDEEHIWDGTKCILLSECSSTSGTPCYDPTSGLTWSPRVSGVNWQGAIDYCKGSTYGGFTDWKLPTISKLRTLIQNCTGTITGGSCAVVDTDSMSCLSYDACSSNACRSCTYNSNGYSKLGETDISWSSSVDADEPDIYAWCVDFSTGTIEAYNQSYDKPVRCVR